MTPVTKRELNQHTAAILARVTAVDDVVVSERGTPRWRISAVRGQGTALTRLARDGRYTPPAAQPAPWPNEPGGPAYTEDDVTTLLDEIRGDH